MIIGISGKKQHGKDTVAQMLQIILQKEEDSKEGYLTWDTKRFADKLKQMVCLLLGCTMQQLEDHKFKETPLGEEWKFYYNFHYKYRIPGFNDLGRLGSIFATLEEAEGELAELHTKWNIYEARIQHKTLTPRDLLQILGTDAGRKLIHPNIWINALMSEYLEQKHRTCSDCRTSFNYEEAYYPDPTDGKMFLCPKCKSMRHASVLVVNPSNWIITDVRFPNEAEAIKRKGGIVLRVNRFKRTSHEWQTMFPNVKVLDPDGWNRQDFHNSWNVECITLQEYQDRVSQSTCKGHIASLDSYFQFDKHESETALDLYQDFDYVIQNDSNLASLESQLHTIPQIIKLKP